VKSAIWAITTNRLQYSVKRVIKPMMHTGASLVKTANCAITQMAGIYGDLITTYNHSFVLTVHTRICTVIAAILLQPGKYPQSPGAVRPVTVAMMHIMVSLAHDATVAIAPGLFET
jgi:hypothetical protein